MVQIHLDPEKLRDFSGDLSKFIDVINNYFNDLSRELNRLGASWQDQEYERFIREFEPARHKLKEFSEEARKLIPKLEKDASAIEDYQKRGR
ncbi:WXG100 family type VII secretion target [Dethiobacter alkaliphilus]|uniref:WXG100 family type VII secretion target n=1 Tax=Dethiobacter alkaliphilus TaxID=427926 RepID=UPI0022270646|nr:WXG100 family type VII secretion target [Dethiobacter alkaliphilus]MCW3488676.1 WXG100 family type VII secretion target [Dethiobacter alkaliphilus]